MCRRSRCTSSRSPTPKLPNVTTAVNIAVTTSLPEVWDDPIFTTTQAAALLAQPHHHLLLAFNEHHQVSGHLLLQAVPTMQADILTLYVPPTHRRSGIARALVQQALTLAKTQGCQGLTLEVDATNTPAITLYQSCGFQHIGTRAAYYRKAVSNTKVDALVMAVSLA